MIFAQQVRGPSCIAETSRTKRLSLFFFNYFSITGFSVTIESKGRSIEDTADALNILKRK